MAASSMSTVSNDCSLTLSTRRRRDAQRQAYSVTLMMGLDACMCTDSAWRQTLECAPARTRAPCRCQAAPTRRQAALSELSACSRDSRIARQGRTAAHRCRVRRARLRDILRRSESDREHSTLTGVALRAALDCEACKNPVWPRCNRDEQNLGLSPCQPA